MRRKRLGEGAHEQCEGRTASNPPPLPLDSAPPTPQDIRRPAAGVFPEQEPPAAFCPKRDFPEDTDTMRTLLPTLAAFLCAAATSAWPGDDNPLKNAKVGDWAAYKTTNKKMGGMAMEMEMKKTVSAKTATQVTIEVVTSVMGQEMKSSYTVDLTQKYDARAVQLKDKGNVEIKELDKGEETITVGGKALKTTWTSFEAVSTAGGQAISTKGKAWACPDVPLDGLVKSEMQVAGAGTMTMELVGFGAGK